MHRVPLFSFLDAKILLFEYCTDMGKWDESPSHEKWFVYGAEAKEGVEKYLAHLTLKYAHIIVLHC